MTIERITEFAPANRYIYDFRYCTYENGWAQIDTRQDASYYGTWANPQRRLVAGAGQHPHRLREGEAVTGREFLGCVELFHCALKRLHNKIAGCRQRRSQS